MRSKQVVSRLCTTVQSKFSFCSPHLVSRIWRALVACLRSFVGFMPPRLLLSMPVAIIARQAFSPCGPAGLRLLPCGPSPFFFRVLSRPLCSPTDRTSGTANAPSTPSYVYVPERVNERANARSYLALSFVDILGKTRQPASQPASHRCRQSDCSCQILCSREWAPVGIDGTSGRTSSEGERRGQLDVHGAFSRSGTLGARVHSHREDLLCGGDGCSVVLLLPPEEEVAVASVGGGGSGGGIPTEVERTRPRSGLPAASFYSSPKLAINRVRAHA